MRINLEINNKSKSPVKKTDFQKIAERSIMESELLFLDEKEIEISAAFISEKEIQEVNRIFRKKDEPTDVLSFPEYAKAEDIRNDKNRKIFLGELLVCYDNIAMYSKKKKLDLNKELKKVFSHGILHLLGFKHGKKMFKIQNEIS